MTAPWEANEHHIKHDWETDFYPVPVLGRIALSLSGFQTAAQYWIEIVHPWVQKFYPVLWLESAGRLLRYFQTSVLNLINFSLQMTTGKGHRNVEFEHFTPRKLISPGKRIPKRLRGASISVFNILTNSNTTLKAKGTLISEPRFFMPCDVQWSLRDTRKRAILMVIP